MGKIFDNINEVNIKGDVSRLSEMVTAIDISLQRIAECTEKLTSDLRRYSTTNKGIQFERVLDTSNKLRDVLFDASWELNELQNQIVKYQDKIYRYEGLKTSAKRPNPYMVRKNQNVNVDTLDFQFDRNSMIGVVACLKEYDETILHNTKEIEHKKNEMAAVWRDPQYRKFSEAVEKIINQVTKARREFNDYVMCLNEKIKEFE